MFCTDRETSEALNSLTTAAQGQARPLVIWVGAGVSVWAGYPLWQELAAKMHTTFSREVRGYDSKTSSRLLKEEKYPELFEQMCLANKPRYLSFLSDQFCPKHSNGVYRRFIRALSKLSPAYIVTTNVDEALEYSLPELITVQRSDIERLPQLLHQRKSFICKLHGSASSVETMIFSKSDYEAIQQNDFYQDAVRSILTNATVLFLGYGLRDEYLFRSLEKSSAERPLFGTGPHFIITSEDRIGLPATVRRIRYVAEVADHRDALQALEVLVDFDPNQTVSALNHDAVSTNSHKSLYFIADLIPPGTVTTSQTMLITSQFGSTHQVIVGEGYVNGEVELYNYSALHDIVVGLICFDIVCISIDHLSQVHDLLGSEAFWIFVRSGSLRLVIPPSTPAITFPDEQAPVGYLSTFHPATITSATNEPGLMGISERIRKQILPVTGKENEAEELIQFLASSVLDGITGYDLSNSLADKTRGALMNPSIRRMLGISPGMPRDAVPRWMSFPILRLAKVINNGLICQKIQASSTRMIWGSEKLASVAFSATASNEWADDEASYVLTGQFNSDVGSIIAQEPGLLLGILKFRESSGGEIFRREIAQRLAADDGGQIVTAINAGLNQALPTSVRQQARDQLSGLFLPRNTASKILPAVWGDLRNSDSRIAGWRKRSRALLGEELKRQKLGPYDECPCGSGDKLKFCCQAALA